MKQNNYRTARNSQTRQTERVTKTDYIPKHNSKGLVNKSSKNKPAFESYLPPRQSWISSRSKYVECGVDT